MKRSLPLAAVLLALALGACASGDPDGPGGSDGSGGGDVLLTDLDGHTAPVGSDPGQPTSGPASLLVRISDLPAGSTTGTAVSVAEAFTRAPDVAACADLPDSSTLAADKAVSGRFVVPGGGQVLSTAATYPAEAIATDRDLLTERTDDYVACTRDGLVSTFSQGAPGVTVTVDSVDVAPAARTSLKGLDPLVALLNAEITLSGNGRTVHVTQHAAFLAHGDVEVGIVYVGDRPMTGFFDTVRSVASRMT